MSLLALNNDILRLLCTAYLCDEQCCLVRRVSRQLHAIVSADRARAVSSTRLYYWAAANNHSHVLRWLYAPAQHYAPPRDDVLLGCVAAVRGARRSLRFLYRHYCTLQARTCAAAAHGGSLRTLRYLHDRAHCALSQHTLLEAARFGHVHLLRYALEQAREPALVDEDVCTEAAHYGQLDVLRYLHERGTRWNADVCARAARYGHLAVLRYAHRRGAPWDYRVIYKAARHGHTDIVRYACNHEAPRTSPYDQGGESNVCAAAARAGSLRTLEYLHRRRFAWDEHVCIEAAHRGDLVMLRWAHERGAPWNASICALAAKYAHLDLLRYAREQADPPCPWDTRVAYEAARGGHLEVLYWAQAHNAPWDDSVARIYCNYLNRAAHTTTYDSDDDDDDTSSNARSTTSRGSWRAAYEALLD